MSYFLPVSYLLVQCILIILPENIKLHAFLRVYTQQAYHPVCTGLRILCLGGWKIILKNQSSSFVCFFLMKTFPDNMRFKRLKTT